MRRKISASVDGRPSGGLACADPGARTPIGASGNLSLIYIISFLHSFSHIYLNMYARKKFEDILKMYLNRAPEISQNLSFVCGMEAKKLMNSF